MTGATTILFYDLSNDISYEKHRNREKGAGIAEKGKCAHNQFCQIEIITKEHTDTALYPTMYISQ